MSKFVFENNSMRNECETKEGICCMSCKYVNKGKKGKTKWNACLYSCIKDKKASSYSCSECKYGTK